MVMINPSNLVSILGKVSGVKICSGIQGKRCFNPRRTNGRLCLECHKTYMKDLRVKNAKGRERVVDGYDFNQEEHI